MSDPIAAKGLSMTEYTVRNAFADNSIDGSEAHSLMQDAADRLKARKEPINPTTVKAEMAAMIHETGLSSEKSASAANDIVNEYMNSTATGLPAEVCFKKVYFDPTEFKMPLTGSLASSMAPPQIAATQPLQVPQQVQKGNACGTTSLSMVLTYYGAPASVAKVDNIDKAIRSKGPAVDMFTAPGDVVSYAKANGFNATMHHNSNTSDIRAMVDQGVPPMLLIDCSPNHDGSGLHYVVVSGYKEVEGKMQYEITDPHGDKHTMSEGELMEQWHNLKVKPSDGSPSVDTPYNCVLITVAPKTGTLKTPTGAQRDVKDLWMPSDNSTLYTAAANKVAGLIGTAGRAINSVASVDPKDLAAKSPK